MKQLLIKFWADDRGSVLAPEWIFVATILALGAVTGMVAQRRAALDRLGDPDSALMQSEASGGELPPGPAR
jgi:hypothetical protein